MLVFNLLVSSYENYSEANMNLISNKNIFVFI